MNSNPFSLVGKKILITGASSGIGRETAIVFSKLGASLVLVARDADKLEETKSKLESFEDHFVYSLDLTDYDEIPNLIKSLQERISKLDGVVHCAGISSTIALRSMSLEKLNQHFDINVNAVFLLTKSLASKRNGLIKDGGSIVFLSSIVASVGEIGKSIYAMSKGAVISGMKSLSIELALRRIRVNAVSPGVVISPMSSQSFYSSNEERLEKIKRLHPLGLGNTVDVANACAYLISDASKWVTGTNLIVDGGYSAR